MGYEHTPKYLAISISCKGRIMSNNGVDSALLLILKNVENLIGL